VDEELWCARGRIVIPEKLSYIVVIIDELADLMLVRRRTSRWPSRHHANGARAGLHCIVATSGERRCHHRRHQSELPARIAFQVAAKVDSRTILDAMGADKLLGKGDMLSSAARLGELIRAQGALITDQEFKASWSSSPAGQPSYEMDIHRQLSRPLGGFEDENGLTRDEEVIEQCIEVIRSEQKAACRSCNAATPRLWPRARIWMSWKTRHRRPGKGAEPGTFDWFGR